MEGNPFVTDERITAYLLDLSDEQISTKLAAIESRASGCRFQSETDGKLYALLRLTQMRKEAR